jgi:hypothetical protein
MLRGIDEWNGQVFRVSRDRRRSLAPARGLRIVNRPAAHSHLASAHLRVSATRPVPRSNVGRTSAMSAESKILAPLYVHRQREESSGRRRGNVVFLALGICPITMHDRKERSQYYACLLRMLAPRIPSSGWPIGDTTTRQINDI